jgi:N-methylhydantoinase B
MGLYSPPLPTVIDTITKALVGAMPECAAAGHHGNFAIHSVTGRDPKSGELFVNIATGIGGWGAMQGRDGAGPYKTMAHGDTPDVPAEAQEALFPLKIDSISLRTDSGGAGEFRGGLGIEKLFTATAPCQLKLSFDRTGCPPWGILGGKDGAAPEVAIERPGKPPEMRFKGTFPLHAGDRVRVKTSGGGGYGDPMRRDPERVARDVRLGYVSRERAESDYGVMLDRSGAVLPEKTASLRKGDSRRSRARHKSRSRESGGAATPRA